MGLQGISEYEIWRTEEENHTTIFLSRGQNGVYSKFYRLFQCFERIVTHIKCAMKCYFLNLIIGGTTPSVELYRAVRKNTDIPIHVLLRPRFGDFLYTAYELEILYEEVKLLFFRTYER